MGAGSYFRVSQDTNTPIPLATLRSHENNTELEGDDEVSDSDASVTSQLFADISDYSKSNTGEENFEENAAFYSRWTTFMKGGGSSNRLFLLVAALCVLLWTVALVIYSNGNAKTKAAVLWHGHDTNIMALGQRNVSLNSFDPTKKNVTFADFRKALYVPSFRPIRWLSPSQFPRSTNLEAKGYYATSKKGKLLVKSADSNYKQVILDSVQFSYKNKFYYAQDVVLNPGFSVDDTSAVHLLQSDSVHQWRHSSFSLFWLWKPVTGEVHPIQPVGHDEQDQLSKLHFAKFDNSGKKVVFGHDHDLFLVDVQTHEVTRITSTASPDIFSGKPDWVYEEEVLARDTALWWSPDSKFLVYAQINDTKVSSYNIDYYVKGPGEVALGYEDMEQLSEDSNFSQYPTHASIKYPKPGTANPIVSLFCYDIGSGTTEEISGLSDEKIKDDFILYDAVWVDGDNLLLKLADRYSSVLEKKIFSPSKGYKAEFVSVQNASDYKGWIEKPPAITLVRKNSGNTETQRDDKSSKSAVGYLDRIVVDGLVQLAYFESASAQNYLKLLGPVNYDSVLSYDGLENCVYGMFGTNLNSSLARVSLEDCSKTILAENGEYGLNFSPNGQFAEIRYEGPNQPSQKLINLALLADHEALISETKNIDHSARLSKVLETTNLPTRVLSSVRIGRDSETVNMIEIFPPNFKKTEKHPLLVHVYGGPGSTTVNKAFNVDFQDIVSSQLNAVVLIIDPRGTGSDDWKFKAHAKDKMGFWEPRDIVSIAKDYITANSYIDKDKTAVWGWSYGGFTTLKALEFDKGETFKYGMAVAPVTNWLFYDSVFTERIMGDPKDNPNYGAISRINEFANFGAVARFLIMQGTADDNVHMQNALWLMDNFDRKGVENYDVHFFPDSDHSIQYHDANTVVYDKLFWWLRQAFTGYFL